MMEQAKRENKEIPVYGMSCQHCVNHVTKILEKFPSVEQVQVSLEDSKATFTWDPAQVNLSDVQQEIEEAGYSLENMAVGLDDQVSSEQVEEQELARAEDIEELNETVGMSSKGSKNNFSRSVA